MSQQIRYPNGFVGTVSDKVAMILIQRPGHALVRPMPDGQPVTNTPAELKAQAEAFAAKVHRELKEDNSHE